MFRYLLTALVLLFALPSYVAAEAPAKSAITFEETSHDYSVLKKGKTYRYDFIYKNEGTTPIVTLDVKTSCVCTKAKWSKKPVKAGETGVITVNYVAKDTGVFHKEIVVITNASPEKTILTVKGSVEK